MHESTDGDRRQPNREDRRQRLQALFERVRCGETQTKLEQLFPMMVGADFVRNEREISF